MKNMHQPCKTALSIGIALATLALTLQAKETNNSASNTPKNSEKTNARGSRILSRTATNFTSPVDIMAYKTLTDDSSEELGLSLQSTAPSFNL